jgi:hypothetical protein
LLPTRFPRVLNVSSLLLSPADLLPSFATARSLICRAGIQKLESRTLPIVGHPTDSAVDFILHSGPANVLLQFTLTDKNRICQTHECKTLDSQSPIIDQM